MPSVIITHKHRVLECSVIFQMSEQVLVNSNITLISMKMYSWNVQEGGYRIMQLCGMARIITNYTHQLAKHMLKECLASSLWLFQKGNSASIAMPGRRDERAWEEVPEEGLRTRCCQTGTLILAPLLISSVTEGKSLNPSGFSLHQCGPEASSVYWPWQTLNAMLHSRQQEQAVQNVGQLTVTDLAQVEHYALGLGDPADRNQCGVCQ